MRKRVCVIIPTYNNSRTLLGVVSGAREYVRDVIVVDDGSTDSTPELLSSCPEGVEVITHKRNKGKGRALVSGFRRARERGFDYAISIDADGQHYPSDIPFFLDATETNPYGIVVGNRFDESLFDRGEKNFDGKSRFANRFSNFWFALQTGVRLDDTQTGFRLYSLKYIYWESLITSRYEAELELLVFASWHGVKISSVPIRVYYPPKEERVSHFRPFQDFSRISLLNTVLCALALVYALPRKLLGGALKYTYLAVLGVLALLVELTLLVSFAVPGDKEKKRLYYHDCIRRGAGWLLRHIWRVRVSDLSDHSRFERPSVIIANHQSALDLLCVMTLATKTVIVTKDWVWRNPFFGTAVRYAEYLPTSVCTMDNDRRIESLLERGYSIIVFPEGTRSKDLKLGRFYSGAFHIAQKYGLEIIPVVLHGTGYVFGKGSRVVRPGEIVIEAGEAVRPTDTQKAGSLARAYEKKYDNWLKTIYD